jgi:hypothetical protein
MKGQVSFESLILTLVIISTVAYISILFLQFNDSTTTMAIIRNELSEQIIQKDQEIIMENISYTNNEKPTFQIKTIPPTLTNEDFNILKITQKIINLTSFSDVNIQIN